MNKEELLEELLLKQRKDVKAKKKLLYSDFKRIVKRTGKSIFTNECVLWKGIVRKHHTIYINFFIRYSKLALHRLLYNNFIAPLDDGDYVYFDCENRGECCCINHMHIRKKKRKVKKKFVKVEKRKLTLTQEEIDEILTLRFE